MPSLLHDALFIDVGYLQDVCYLQAQAVLPLRQGIPASVIMYYFHWLLIKIKQPVANVHPFPLGSITSTETLCIP
jgi:hypothetical protein